MALDLTETLLDKVKKAVTSEILLPEHYEAAISATRNDPAVVEYLQSLMPSDNVPSYTGSIDPETLEIDYDPKINPNPRSVKEITTTEKPTSKGTNPRAAALAEQREATETVTEKPVEDGSEVLTLKKINGSPTLRRLGALSGDRIVDGKLERVFSKKEDTMQKGKVLTGQDILNSANLQKLNAAVGDRIVGTKLHRTEEDNNWVQFKYGYDEQNGMIADAAQWLEARVPIGEVKFDFTVNNFKDLIALPSSMASYSSPDDIHGEGFSEATVAQRREMIVATKERKLQESYGRYMQPDEDSGYRTAGNITGFLADPTTLAPVGQTKTAMAGIGAVLGGGSSILSDAVTRSGEVDLKKAAISTGAGAILAPAVGVGASKISKLVSDRSAKKVMIKAQAAIDQHMALGGTSDDLAAVFIRQGIDPSSINAASTRSGVKLVVHADSSSAEKAVNKAITKDSAVSRLYSPRIDKYLGILSTRIGNISEAVKGRMRRFEYDSAVNTSKASKKAEPFLKALKKMDSNVKVKLNKALSNGDFKSAVGIMRSVSPEIATEFVDVIQPMLKKMGEDLRKAGHTFTAVDNYFPRLVKDYDKYSASWGKIKAGKIDEALESYAKRKGTVTNLLSGDEKSKVIDLTMRGYRQTTDGWQPPNVKQRQFESLTDDQVQFYADPEEALSMYIRNSIHDIEKRKFFGRTAVQDKLGGFDTDTSIGAVVQKAMKDGDITKEQQQELVELLKARFVGGEQAMGSLTSNVRNLGYMGTIANSISAITQLADVGIASSLKGFRNSIGSMFGTKQLTLIDIGLDDVITKELANGDPRLTARALNKLMSLALFKYTDKLGKETFMNAAFKKAQQMVKSEKGEAAFRKKAGKLYGDELESLVADLKSGEITENVKFFAFNELSNVQPVSLMEMPEGYLNMKGGRLLYMLKSFTLKQFDIVRREVIQQWQRGEKTEAVKNAALLAGYISASQTGISVTKDFILGREVKPEDIPDKALWGLMGVFGMNEYTYDKYLKQGKFKEAGFNYLAPATPIFEAALTLGMELPKDDPNIEPAMKAVPLVGPFLYNWVGGGAEKANERREDKRRDKRMGN